MSDTSQNKDKRGDTPKILSLIHSLVTMTLLMFYMIIGFILYLKFCTDYVDKGFDKEKIQSDLKTIIQNGADLSNINHVYKSREIKSASFFEMMSQKNLGFYNEDTPLSSILDDLLLLYYMNPVDSDTIYLSRLKSLIKEHQKHNPFDNLDEGQRFYFENIQQKTGDKYNLIQYDLDKISQELKNKNNLVTKYLDNSDYSFYLSIVALVFALLTTFYQISKSTKDNVNMCNKIQNEFNKVQDTLKELRG